MVLVLVLVFLFLFLPLLDFEGDGSNKPGPMMVSPRGAFNESPLPTPPPTPPAYSPSLTPSLSKDYADFELFNHHSLLVKSLAKRPGKVHEDLGMRILYI